MWIITYQRFFKKVGRNYKLQESLLKQELEHDEFSEDNWEEKENELLPYLKNDISSTVFSYARYSKGMEELTGFGMENSLTLPSLANKYFNSLRDENNETIYTYNDEYMRRFVRQSIKRGCCSASNQYYKSTISDQVFNIMSQDLGVNCSICKILDKYFEITNKRRKIIETNMIHNMKTIEMFIKKKELNILTTNLVKYHYTKSYKNSILMML